MRTIEKCPACNSAHVKTAAKLDDYKRTQYFHFSKVKYGGLLDQWINEIQPVVNGCIECGHHWYKHQPESSQLMQMYAAGRPIISASKPSREPTQKMIAEMRKFYELLKRNKDAISFLDYGSGYGRWARAALQAGFSVTAFEPSQERGEERDISFELVHETADLEGRTFDAIQLEQVLEHVPVPLETLSFLKNLCAEHTIIRITVPNILRTPERKKIWETWPFDGKSPHVLAPYEHLHGFTPTSLKRLVRRAGFQPLSNYEVAKQYPSMPIREAVSKIMPSLGSTFLFVQKTQT